VSARERKVLVAFASAISAISKTLLAKVPDMQPTTSAMMSESLQAVTPLWQWRRSSRRMCRRLIDLRSRSFGTAGNTFCIGFKSRRQG
jgi:hypothetical protein